MSMEDYPADWSKRRKNVFERDDHTCRGCGERKPTNEGLHCHHIVPLSEGGGNSFDNLITLCEDCHMSVHSSRQDPPLRPLESYECNTCSREYIEGHGEMPGYCSKRCFAKEQAIKALNVVEHDLRICSTCYTEINPDNEPCPNCGAWERSERNDELLEEGDIDVEHLLLRVMYWVEFGE